MNRLSQAWLQAASDDLDVIEQILSQPHLTHLVAFHSQQAIEKAFKALMEENGENIPKIHSLNKLFDLNKSEFVCDDTDLFHTLDELYIESRYPGDFGLMPNGKPTVEEAKEFYEFAKTIYQQTKQKIGQ